LSSNILCAPDSKPLKT